MFEIEFEGSVISVEQDSKVRIIGNRIEIRVLDNSFSSVNHSKSEKMAMSLGEQVYKKKTREYTMAKAGELSLSEQVRNHMYDLLSSGPKRSIDVTREVRKKFEGRNHIDSIMYQQSSKINNGKRLLNKMVCGHWLM